MKKNKWPQLYENDILKHGGFETYYYRKIKYRKKLICKIIKYSNVSKKVLEAGCGTGVISIWFSSHNYRSYAVDFDLQMLELVKKISLTVSDNFPMLLNENIFNLHNQFKRDEFDVVYSIGVYEHFNDNEIKKLIYSQLKISKYVFVGIPTKYFNDNEKLYGNERFLNLNYWRKLFQLKDIKIVEEFTCYNESLFHRLINYIKWFKPAPIHVFVIKKLKTKLK